MSVKQNHTRPSGWYSVTRRLMGSFVGVSVDYFDGEKWNSGTPPIRVWRKMNAQ